MKLDVLVIAVHPDDAEMCAGGTILSHVANGHTVGIIDLTYGELGTRGSAEIRDRESQEAAKVLGLSLRENMGFRDGFFANDEAHQRAIIQKIRQYQPELLLTNAPADRHPDHGRAGQLAKEAAFYSGLPKVETSAEDGRPQPSWRPHMVYQFIQYYYLQPHIVVDIKEQADKKMEAVTAYKSQFFNEDSTEQETILTRPGFFEMLRARWREMGAAAHLEMGEGFLSDRTVAVDHLLQLPYNGSA
jgi:bacillithiol biosynthesis deacetylase BshB1